MTLLTVIFWAAIFATLSGLVTNAKGRGWWDGLVLGGLLGIIGLVICAFLKTRVDEPEVRR